MLSEINLDDPTVETGENRRMAELATLPIFFKLSGKRVVIAGAQDAALWKAELLASAGAQIELFAVEVSPEFVALSERLGENRVTLLRRSWAEADLTGAALAIAAATTDAEAIAFSKAARAAGVPVNVIDRPEFCDFQFGAIVNRSPLIVAISTDGAAPVFGQAIRSAIEGLLPSSFKQWTAAAKSWRRLGDRLGADMSARRKFWERFTDLAFTNADRMPVDADVERLLASDAAGTLVAATASITILCLGDGGADNLTLAAVRALRTADHVCCDATVPAAVSDFARREASRSRFSGGGVAEAPWHDDIGTLVALARSGKRVVVVQRGADATALTKALTSVGILAFPIHSGRAGTPSPIDT